MAEVEGDDVIDRLTLYKALWSVGAGGGRGNQLGRKVDDITEMMNRNMVTITGSMENIKNNQDMGYIMEKLTALQRQMDRFGDQAG
ncbi:hypothetical protein D9C73_006026 [Collichthys lucidus]|uniref:Uncharacterized protein n=1 Tax=Collichthys lucidus TaxID=240159 RepID=A0A4U5UBZ3_COLLU|nr:hypothetical protein D9C73_006026 [Collichthys lucidus]